MFRAIIRIDMALVDQKVFEVISRKLAGNPSGYLTLNTIADEVRCHPNTVWRAVNRLASTGRIVIEGHGRNGSEYRLVET